jgi:hypothetical protein
MFTIIDKAIGYIYEHYQNGEKDLNKKVKHLRLTFFEILWIFFCPLTVNIGEQPVPTHFVE